MTGLSAHERRRMAEIARDNAMVCREQAAVLGVRAHRLYQDATRWEDQAVEHERIAAELEHAEDTEEPTDG